MLLGRAVDRLSCFEATFEQKAAGGAALNPIEHRKP